jgi:ABC-type Zn uptake system ZnuABC Zn-binding protein ZnuA
VKRYLAAFLALLMLAAWAQPRAVATLPPYASLAGYVLGKGWTVETLLPAGANPHLYQPRPSDLKRVAGARLVIMNGFGLDDWVVERLVRPNNLKARVLSAEAGLKPHAVRLPSGEVDPHVWTDPLLMALFGFDLARVAGTLDPEHKDAYLTRARQLADRLFSLDHQLREALARAPGRAFVAYKNPFSYLVRRYDLRRVFLIGKSPSAGVTPKELAEAARVLKAHHLKGFLSPYQLLPEARRVAQNLGTKAYPLYLLDEADPDYFKTWQENLKALAAVLGE